MNDLENLSQIVERMHAHTMRLEEIGFSIMKTLDEMGKVEEANKDNEDE